MSLGYECETAVVIKMRRMYAQLATLTFLIISLQLPLQSEELHITTAAAPCDRSRKVFTEPYGEISDGPSGYNYTQDSHCEWLIKAKNDSQFITLTFHSMGTECSYDYIYVYDGDSFNSTLLGSFSGRTQPQRLVARSGSVSGLGLYVNIYHFKFLPCRCSYLCTAIPTMCWMASVLPTTYQTV